MRGRIIRAFSGLGISEERIEFRGFTPYHAMLTEYQDIDIALDTFPFNGGMTSCNAISMGVPLVTLKGHSVAARQGYCILANLDLEELVAETPEQYISIACGLAANPLLLEVLHASLRFRLKNSLLTDYKNCAKELEKAFYILYSRRVEIDEKRNYHK